MYVQVDTLSGANYNIGEGRPRLSRLAGLRVEALLHRRVVPNADGLRRGPHRAARVPFAVQEGGVRRAGGAPVHRLHQGGPLHRASPSRPVRRRDVGRLEQLHVGRQLLLRVGLNQTERA